MYTLKKSLGQHFLKDNAILERIVAALKEHSFSQLLEVGPGGGALTQHLLHLPGVNFKAVELDEEKIAYLQKTFPPLQDKIIAGDFLKTTVPFEGEFLVIGNFPYNISSQILLKLLDWKEQVPVIIGMFQKEVAERVAAAPGSKTYGVISALLQPYYSIRYLFDVPPEAFTPPPKVMSGVIELIRRKDVPAMKSARAYKALVKAAFNQRRKTMRNATRGLFAPELMADPIFDKRAEALSVDDFAMLSFKMTGFDK